MHSIISWFLDANEAPVPCGLADHPHFLQFKSHADIYADHGSSFPCLASRENCKVFSKPFHLLPRRRQAVWLNIFVQMEAEAARVERRAHQRPAKKQDRSENNLPAPNFARNFASILSPACTPQQSWTSLSSGAAPHGLPSSPESSSASSVALSSACLVCTAICRMKRENKYHFYTDQY